MNKLVVAPAVVLFVICMVCRAFSADLPDAKLTPGKPDPTLTTERLCAKGFSTKTVRNVTIETRVAAFGGYGIVCKNRTPTCAKEFELDHLVSLELGGSNDVLNLWPEAHAGQWGARVKDQLENKLHALVCAGTITLDEAQNGIATDWISLYKKWMPQ